MEYIQGGYPPVNDGKDKTVAPVVRPEKRGDGAQRLWEEEDKRLKDVLPLLECELTIAQAAEKLGITMEATSALIEASLGGSSLSEGQ